MKPIKTRLMAATLLAALSGLAMAHGDSHATKPDAVKKEQKDWGIAADAQAAKRTVVFTMSDSMRFTPDTLTVKQGETIKIVVRNKGKMLHEFVLGTKKELDEHAALMLKFPTMEHDEPYMAHVPPGKSGEILWTFNRAGDFDFACLIAGHYQAGMVGKVKVTAASAQQKADDHGTHHASTAASAADMTEGEIRKIDKDAMKLTIKHNEIKSMDMPPMTMVFQVKDGALLDRVKAGDKIRFAVEKSASGLVVTNIEVAK